MPRTGRGPVPILFVVLDGMADRPYRELDGRTPLEAARTPVMDRLVREGEAGFCYPLGPGRVPSTELSHFRFFGYHGYPFPGRACLEAVGHNIPCAAGDIFSFLALRQAVREDDGTFRIVGRYGEGFEDAGTGYAALDGWEDGPSGYRFEVFSLSNGEAILRVRQASSPIPPCGDVTDSDPFLFTGLPVLRPRPLNRSELPKAAEQTADALNRFLVRAAEVFGSPSGVRHRGVRRVTRLVVSKWTGTFTPLPKFAELTGADGVSVASTGLFRGLAGTLGLRFVPGPAASAPGEDLAGKLDRALGTVSSGEAGFAHVHTKAADEASHGGDVASKVAVVEELDEGLAPLLDVPPDRLVLCVTSDHCTPVGGRTVHWGDSVPLLVRGPYVRVDGVTAFHERSVVYGGVGQIGAADILPYLLCQADRAHFLGARPAPFVPLGVPETGEPWTGVDVS